MSRSTKMVIVIASLALMTACDQGYRMQPQGLVRSGQSWTITQDDTSLVISDTFKGLVGEYWLDLYVTIQRPGSETTELRSVILSADGKRYPAAIEPGADKGEYLVHWKFDPKSSASDIAGQKCTITFAVQVETTTLTFPIEYTRGNLAA